MEKKQSELKILSIAAFIFAALTAIVVAIAVIAVDYGAGLPAEQAGIVNAVTKVIYVIIGLVIIALEAYLGYRGLKEVKNPTQGKGHIIIACILMVLSLLSIGSPIAAIISGVDVWGNIGSLCTTIVQAMLYLMYAKAARDLQKAA